MAQTVNILHLSDLHYERGTIAYDQNVVMDALKEDLHKVCSGLLKPDLIVFSGDIVFCGDDEDIYLHFHEDHLAEIAKITRCDESRIFLCPGNHDAQREVVKKRNKEQAKLARDLKGRDELNTAYLDGQLNELVNDKFNKFEEYIQLLTTPKPLINDGIVRVVKVDGLPVDIVCLNTAWMTWAGIKKYGEDRGNLIFPEAALTNAINNCNPRNFQVYVAHHPISWFTEISERDFMNTLKAAGTNPYLYLHGHLHDPQPKQVKGLTGESLTCQSGALYGGRARYNGYSIITFDLDDPQFVVHLQSYSDKSRKFAAGVDIAPPDGKFFSSKHSKAFWHRYSQQVERESVKSWLGLSLLAAAKSTYDEGLTDRPLCDVFVPPPMYLRTEFYEGKGEELPERHDISISISDIGSSGENYIIQGRPEYGKTTLLQQLALQLMQNASEEIRSLTVPIVIDFASINPGREPVGGALRKSLIVDLPSGTALTNLLDEGLVTILIDDVEFADRVRIKLLKAFIEKNLRNRYILTTSVDENNLLENSLAPKAETLISFRNVFLKPFTRGNMRNLVKKWDRSGLLDQESILNRLIREMTGMHIPVTAVNGSILLSIYEDQPGYAPINRTALIERFLEHVLDKRSVKETIRGTFDFLNKIHLLSYFAKQMALEDRYVLSRIEVIRIFQTYLEQVGLAINEDSLLRHFIETRIIAEKPEDTVSFSYRAFLEYFIACQIKFDEKFRDWILSDGNYLRFINEIKYYAGMDRTDQSLLELVGNRFDTLTAKLFEEFEWDLDLTNVDNFVLPTGETDEDIFDDLSRQIQSPPLGEKERDEVLDAEIPRDAQERQQVFRPTLKDSGQRWITALLLYSGILKNLDLISDTVKRNHLCKVLKAWGYFSLQTLNSVPILAKMRRIRINGVLYEVLLPPHLKTGEAARLIYMELPNAVSHLIMWHLGTEKLQIQLVEPKLGEIDEPLISTYYRHTLIADLRFSGWPEALIEFSKTLKRYPYLQETLLRKMTAIYLLGGHRPDTEIHLKELIGEVLSEIRSKSAKDRKRIKSDAIQQIEQRAYIRRLKIDAEEKTERQEFDKQ